MEITLSVKGMTCNHCEQSVKNALQKENGVEGVEVHLTAGKVDVTFDEGLLNPKKVEQVIEDQGYDVIR